MGSVCLWLMLMIAYQHYAKSRPIRPTKHE